MQYLQFRSLFQSGYWSSFQKRICSFSPKTLTVSKIGTATIGSLYKERWAEKESFQDYIIRKMPKIQTYLDGLKMLPQEEEFYQQIHHDYSRQNFKNIYPFKVSLGIDTKTFENSKGDFLSEKEIKFYIENGIIGPTLIDTLSNETIKAIFRKFSGIPDHLTPQQYRDIRVRQEWQSLDILNVICNHQIVSKISSLLGPDIMVRFTAIHEIGAKTGSFASITDNKVPELCAHSDTNFGARISKRGLHGTVVGLDSINVWISINGTNPNNGPLYVFPKTHNWAIMTPLKYLEHAKRDQATLDKTIKLLSKLGFGNEMIANHALFFNYLQEAEYSQELPKIKRVEIYTQPKECLIFSTHILHGSDVNLTNETRLAISVRYCPATTEENEDNLQAVKTMFTKDELLRLGLDEQETRNPIIQVLGSNCHIKSKPVKLDQLRQILEEKRQ